MKKSLLILAVLVLSCGAPAEKKLIENTGYAQGSTYQVKYLNTSGEDLGEEITRIFQEIDVSMSTYNPNSMISGINKGDTVVTVDQHFLKVLNRSVEIAKETEGAFDPTVGPLVRMWGFNFEEIRQDVSDEMIVEAKALTGYEQLEVNGNQVRLPAGFSLDFNAIAQGYTVDVIAEMLEENGIEDYMVEVGGEIRTLGVNDQGNVWTIGVDKPQENIDTEERFQFILGLENAGLATSGNYRRFWVDEETGIKYSHTIDPETGRPAKNRLLSASLIAPTAMDADAYATVCMVIGLEECKALLEEKTNLEGYLVYTDEAGEWVTFVTPGFEKMVIDQ